MDPFLKRRKQHLPRMRGPPGKGKSCLPLGGSPEEEIFSNSASIGIGGENRGLKFAVLGLVDLERIPDDKKNLPLGDKESPIPLVEFLKPEKNIAAPSKTASARPLSGNDYWSCGSGKNFKNAAVLSYSKISLLGAVNGLRQTT